jgi:hypothetical protein
MSYNFNSIASVPPTGAVAPYVGATDPSGWVICDGISRNNASGQYNNLINAGLVYVGSTTVPNTTYTPPQISNTTSTDGTIVYYIIKI